MSLSFKMSKAAQRVGLFVAGAFAVALLLAHFLHLRADFPNFSPWMDYAKYTDEGWYGSAAVAYFIRGGWYVPGDFNPAVALPVWPLMEWLLFHLTGVSITAARMLAVGIFCANVGLTYALVRSQAPRWAAGLAAVLAVSNSFLFCFSRLAILEPPLILLMLAAWLLALRMPQARSPVARRAVQAGVGLLLCGMVLTKTTAVFLFPSVFYLVWSAQRENLRAALRSCVVVLLTAAGPWLAYYAIAVRPHYLEDYRYLFTANLFRQPTTLSGWLMALWYAVHGTLWIDTTLVSIAALALLASLLPLRSVWQRPLFAASCLGCAGYLLFIGYHNNMQPRYYQVVAFPLIIMVAVAVSELLRQRQVWRSVAASGVAFAIVFGLFVNTRQTLWFASHPQYTFVDAAENLTRYIDTHPNRNRLLLSISGSNIALVTGLPAICDDFGTLDLDDRIRQYQPGWYAAWNELDPGTLQDLQSQFNLQQVANFQAYDDEDRNNLILYKLTPIEQAAPKPKHRQRRRQGLGGLAGKAARMRPVGYSVR